MKIGEHETHPASDAFPLMSGVDYEDLRKDIEENGLREDIVLIGLGEDQEGILDGRNRYRACVDAGVTPTFTRYKGEDPIGFVLSKNLRRRHLNEAQRAMVAAKIKPLFEEQARERMLAGKAVDPGANLPEGQEGDPGANLPEGQKKGRARDQAAAAVNVSGRSVSKAEKVIDGGCDELNDAVNNGGLSLDIAEKIAKRPVKEQRQILQKCEENPKQNPSSVLLRHDKDKIVAKLKSEPQPPPEGPFRVIVADPPWPYEKRPDDGTQRGQTPYPGMTLEELYKLVDMIDKLAADDCILFLWATNAHLADGTANAVLDCWRFEGKTVLTWVKDKMGTGDWLRGKTEHCILAVRGNPVVDLHGQSTELRGAVREHSRKPEEFYKLVEGLCPGSKLEMFATEAREGWQMWAPGNWREETKE